MPFTIGGEWVAEPAPTLPKKPLKIVLEQRKGAFVTLILNIKPHYSDLKALCSALKQKFACGGAVKKETIELQGDQLKGAKLYLKELGLKV